MAKADGYKIKTPEPKKRPPRRNVWVFFALSLVCASLAAIAWLGIDELPAMGEPSGTSGKYTIVTGTRHTLPTKPASSSTTDAAQSTTKTTTAKKTVATTTTANPRKDILICLDPGHGGRFPGTSATYKGSKVYEKDIVLDVALRAEEHLKSMGYSVLLTRNDDNSILSSGDNIDDVVARVEKAKAAGADMLISIHCNAYEGSSRAWGPIVFYHSGKMGYNGAAYAELFSECVTANTSSIGVRASRTRAGNDYAVLTGKNLPSILFETGFMTDSTELSLMMTEKWRAAMALAIANSVESAYLSKMLP